MRAAVRERAARGVHVVKVMATGGYLTPGSRVLEPQYTLEELRAAAEEAHRHGLPITAHAHGPGSIADAVAAGFDMIEHCFFATDDGVDYDERVLGQMARKGVVASLTLGELPGGTPPPWITTRSAGVAAGLRRMQSLGVTMTCGSDAGIRATKPHGRLADSVTALARMGVPALTVLQSVTSAAARALGVAARKGRIAPGMDADIVAVGGNPLDDPGALLAVTAVLRAGQRVR